MNKFVLYILISLFLSLGVQAKTLDQKKDELKKIYEAGGLSKVEYEKAVEFLENDNKKPKKVKKVKKKSFSLKNQKKKKN